MLAYVAVTRAKQVLDNDGLAWIHNDEYASTPPSVQPVPTRQVSQPALPAPPSADARVEI